MRTLPIISLLLCFAQAGPAQQAPAPQDDAKAAKPAKKKADAKEKDKGAKKAPAEDATQPPAADDENTPPTKEEKFPRKLPPRSDVYIEAGYGDWGLSGSEHKFRQYGTLPHGFFIRDLRLMPSFKSAAQTAFFDFKGIGQDDYRAESWLNWSYGKTRLAGFLSQSKYFDPTPAQVDLSSRRVNGINGKQFLNRDFALSFRYREDIQNKYYGAPALPLNQDTQYIDAVAAGKLGRGFLNLSASSLRFADNTGTLPGTTTQTVGLHYLWEPSSTVGIEAEASHVVISQTDAHEAHVDTMALTGDVALSADTDLGIRLQRRSLSLPVVQSAYVRSQDLAAINLTHRWTDWRGTVGFRLQNDERVDGTQTFVDVPKWSTVEGRIAGKLSPDFKFTLRGYTQSLNNPPPAITSDTRSLYWSGRDYAQARLEGTWQNFNSYATFTYRDYRNSARESEVKSNQFTVGGVWQIGPYLNMFAEYDYERWTGQTDSSVFPTLSNFLPDSSTGVVELTWNLRSHVFLSLSYTGFATFNDNPLLLPDGNTKGGFLTINTRYRFPAGYELGLILAPWSYTDNVANTMNYNATVFMLTGSARF